MKINITDPLMKALKAVNTVSKGSTTLSEEDLAKQRSSMERVSKFGTPPLHIAVEKQDIGGIACEWVRPEFAHNKDYVILYAHGGGYTCGGLSYARILGAKMALSTGLEVLSFEYRLAPENKYPAALDDGMTLWNFLMQLGYGAKNVILAGDSAGGNMVLSMTHKIKSEGRYLPKAILLFSPWTDMTATSDSYEKYKDIDPILTKDYVVAVRDAYIGGIIEPGSVEASPLFGDFDGFPPTFIQVGKNEILLEDSSQLAKKMQKAGVEAEIIVYKDGWHVFQQMPISLASKAMGDVGEFVRKQIYNIRG